MASRKPPWLDQIRFVAAYYLSGCEAPWSLYAEQAQEPAGEILAVFLDFSLKDYVKELFRPKGLRSKRHGRKGRKNRPYAPGIPDLNEETAKRTPGKELLYNRKYGLPTAAFYVVDDVVDRVAWTIALLEMSGDLLYDTLLGVLEHKGEDCPNIGRLARKGGFHVEGGPVPSPYPIGQGALQYAVKAQGISGNSSFLPAGNWSVTCGMQVRAPSGATDFYCRIQQFGGANRRLAETGWLVAPTSGSVTVLLNCTVRGPITLGITGGHVSGFWDVLVSDLQIVEII